MMKKNYQKIINSWWNRFCIYIARRALTNGWEVTSLSKHLLRKYESYQKLSIYYVMQKI